MRNQIMERQDGPILAAYNVTAAATCPPWWSPFFADGLLQLFFPSFFHGILNLLFVIFASIFVDLFTVVPPPHFFLSFIPIKYCSRHSLLRDFTRNIILAFNIHTSST